MAILPVVLRSGFQVGGRGPLGRGSLPHEMQVLRRKNNALHALLPLVPSQGSQGMAGQDLPGNLHKMRLVGRY